MTRDCITVLPVFLGPTPKFTITSVIIGTTNINITVTITRCRRPTYYINVRNVLAGKRMTCPDRRTRVRLAKREINSSVTSSSMVAAND